MVVGVEVDRHSTKGGGGKPQHAIEPSLKRQVHRYPVPMSSHFMTCTLYIYVETDLKNGSFNLSDLNLEFSFSAALSLPAAVRLSMQMLDCGDFLALNFRKHAGAVG